jgi:cell division protein ZapA
MDDKFLIHVEIAGKEYGIRIKRSEEELIRNAAKQIRMKLTQYRSAYTKPDLTEKDFLAMVALHLSIENLTLEDRNDTSPFTDKIIQLTDELDAYLKEK